MSVIKAGTTVTTALVLEGNTDGDLIFKTGSAAVTAMSISASGVVTFPATTTIGTLYFGAGTATTPSISTINDANTGIYFPASDQVALTTGGTQRFLVNASGNVGIGISNPTYLLEMEGSAPRATIRGTTNGSNVGYRLDTKDSGGTQRYGGYYYQPQTGTNESYLGLSADDSGYQLGVKANGNVFLLGGATNVTGTGITFPATQSASSNANTLDDYEEGSFTPTIDGATSATVTDAVGRYIKVGRYVWFQGRIDWNSLTGTTNKFGGLPFTSVSGAGEAGYSMTVTPYVNSGFGAIPAGKGYLNGYVVTGGTVIHFTWQPTTTTANLDTSGNVYFAGGYIAAN